MRYSSGFLIKSNGLYLIAHVTQLTKIIPSVEDSKWSIPKGRLEEGESILAAALREVYEETNIDLASYEGFDTSKVEAIDSYNSTKNKVVYVYFFNDISGNLRNVDLKCNSYVQDHSDSRYNGILENDEFKWVTKEEGERMVFLSQKHLFQLDNI